MLRLTDRPPEFFKKFGFRTKKQALEAIRVEEIKKGRKKNWLFDSYESFFVFSINFLT